ncbi:MAG: DsbA family protein [Candidatus Nanohaloarchaea archaeon]|nr:DsbA family protein [Candidatus Nanohaloarchaea archaeon]
MADDDGLVTLEFQVRHALILAFVVGLFAGGFFMSAVNAVAGPTGAIVQPQDGSSGDTQPSPSPSGTQGTQGGSQDSQVSVSGIDFKNDPVIGSSDAPVTVVAWEDYQCPFCQRFEQNAFPKIKKNYIDTGKVRFVFKDFAFLGSDSTSGSVASQCVWRQVGDSSPAAWSRWKNAMFDNQDGENSGWGSQDDIIAMTRNVSGVDASQLESCMNSNAQAIQQELSTDKSQGQNAGISGTPGFVVYADGSDTGTKIVGAQPYSRFQSVIDSKLSG